MAARGRRLSGPPFRAPRVKTALPARDRYALVMVREQLGGGEPCQAVLRRVIEAGLEAMGWNEQRRRTEYAEYVYKCASNGDTNEFEGR